MSPLGIIELLEQYPPWFKWGVAVWVLFAAVLLVGLLTLRQVRVDPKTSETSLQQAAPVTGPLGAPTFGEYERRWYAFADRFHERQEYVSSLSGTAVTWEGHVSAVSEKPPYVLITMTSEPGKGMPALITLPPSTRTKAFSLRGDDLIRVTGKLSLRVPNAPDIDATDFQVVKPKGGG